MFSIDLNCDIGENVGSDEEILPFITSASIACGVHAGDAATMRRAVRLALERGVAIGAHPSLDDREGFGRRELAVSPQEAHDLVLGQITKLYDIVRESGGRMHHVKPHGALYNMAARDADLARAISEAVRGLDPGLLLFGLAGSHLIIAAEEVGLRGINEVFADRGYEPDGSLMARSRPGALVTDAGEVADRALLLARDGTIAASDGSSLHLRADTICIHGDTPNAPLLARSIRKKLSEAGVAVLAPKGSV